MRPEASRKNRLGREQRRDRSPAANRPTTTNAIRHSASGKQKDFCGSLPEAGIGR